MRLRRSPKPPPAPAKPGEVLNANTASFEELREIGMSVTQATRVIAYRERNKGFDEVDDLDAVPGFPKAFLADLKSQLTV